MNMNKSTAYFLYLVLVGAVGFVLGNQGYTLTDAVFWVIITGLFLAKELGGYINGKT